MGWTTTRSAVDVWLAVQEDKTGVACRRNETDRAASLLASMRPLVDARGNSIAVSNYYNLLSRQHIFEQRYRVDAAMVEEHRRAVTAGHAVEVTGWYLGNPETGRFSTLLELGTALTWYGDLAEAHRVHSQALAAVERVGTPNGRSMVLTALAITVWRQGDVQAVGELTARARAVAASGPRTGYNWYYVTAATAALEAWAAWRDHRSEEVIALGTQALDLWRSHLKTYPFRCVALFPLASTYLHLGQTEEAFDSARQTLEPTQARLPDELEAAVQAACDAWETGDPELSRGLLDGAVSFPLATSATPKAPRGA